LEARSIALEQDLERAVQDMPAYQANKIQELEKEVRRLRMEAEDNVKKWTEDRGYMEQQIEDLKVSV
jgi:hypothetical protein